MIPRQFDPQWRPTGRQYHPRAFQAAWRPLVELNRLKHLRYRRKLEARPRPAPGLVMLEPAS